MVATEELELTSEEIKNIAQKGRDNFFFFTRAILAFNKVDPIIHMPLCGILEDYEVETRVMIILPRDWYKTTIATIAYPVWRAIKNPDLRILFVQYTFSNACKKLNSIKGIFEKNMLFRTCYKELLPTSDCIWKNEALCITRKISAPESTFEAAGTGTQVTGRHYGLIVEDDTVAPDIDNMTGILMQPTQADIEKAIGWHRLAHPLLIEPLESQILVIGTRWAERDLLQWVEENEPSYKIVTRAVKENEYGDPDDDGKIIWPKRFNQVVIDQLKTALGLYMYSALYLNSPLAAGNQVFRSEWIRYYTDIPPNCIFATAVDPAAADSDSTSDPDYNVTETIAIDAMTGRIYIVHYDRERCDPGQVINKIFDHNRAFNPITTKVESNAYQKTLAYWINQRQQSENDYFLVEPVNNIRSKEDRIKGLQPFFAAGKVFIKTDMSAFESELLAFPRGRHDDLIDALSTLLPIIVRVSRKAKDVVEQSITKNIVGQLISELREKNNKTDFKSSIGLNKITGTSDINSEFMSTYNKALIGTR